MSVEARLRDLADRDLAEWPTMPSRSVLVLAPGRGVDVEVAAGVADTATGAPAEPGSRFRIASVTKPFVAAATLRLVEEGRFGLDDPIAGLIGDGSVSLLREGGYDPDAITVRHLLTHTSGIYDFAADAYDASIDGFTKAVYADPGHRWTREEQVAVRDHARPALRRARDRVRLLGHRRVPRWRDHRARRPARRWAPRSASSSATSAWACAPRGRRRSSPSRRTSRRSRTSTRASWDVADFDASVDLYGGGGLMSTCRRPGAVLPRPVRGRGLPRRGTLATMTTTVDVPLAEGVGDDDDPRKAAMYLFRDAPRRAGLVGPRRVLGHDGVHVPVARRHRRGRPPALRHARRVRSAPDPRRRARRPGLSAQAAPRSRRCRRA